MRFFPLLNAILRGSLNANGKKIENLAAPTNDNDAATKKYVDEHGGGGSVTLDDAVTRTSANGVKSSGIWSAIWGALTALPSGFTSLYDWCVSQFAKKVDAQIIPAGAYTFTNGVNGFRAWAWRENGNWKAYAINIPSNLGNIVITDDEHEPVIFTNDFVYLSGSDDSYSWNADSGALSFFDGYPNTIVTNADIPIQDFIANLTTMAAKAKIAEAMESALSGKLDKTDVIKQSAVTSSTPDGKAADAKDMKNALAGKLDKTGGALTGELHIDGTGYDHRALRLGVFTESPGATYITPYGIGVNRTETPRSDDDVDISWSELFKIGNLAPAYSPAKTGGYAVDDFCSKDGKIYQCVAATSGGWDSTKWRERNLSSLFSNDNGLGNSWIDGRIASGVPLLITPYTHYDLADKTAVEGVVTLADRTFNRVAVSADETTFTLPTAITGKARDLAIYIKASVAEATLSFDETTNTIRGDDMPVTAVGGEYLVLLTEIDTDSGKTVWNCSVKDITPAA